MRRSKKYFGKLIVACLISLSFPGTVLAGAELLLRKTSPDKIEVVLSNDEPVAALQFTLNGQGTNLLAVSRGLRLQGTGWLLSSNNVNESTINVVLIRSGIENLESGSGAVVYVSVEEASSGTISLSRVIVASPGAESIATTVTGLEWSESSATLGQNFPNPFNPRTTIPYRIEDESRVRLVVYDATGREISRILDEHQLPGAYSASWSGTDESGFRVPSGVYFVRLEAGPTVMTRKMILTK